jgi:hypothetical protein
MKKKTWMLILLNATLALVLFNTKHFVSPSKPIVNPSPIPEVVEPHTNISLKTPEFLNYEDLTKQLEVWKSEAPELVEVGTYGKSLNKKNLTYLRICKDKKANLPKVLITACIHGNESWSTGCVMAYIGNLLYEFEHNEEVKNLILSRDLYFVPVVSPDTYPSFRYIKKIDPNRNFPTQKQVNHESITPIKELQELFMEIRPKAVFSGHTSGRLYLMPYADQRTKCPNYQEYVDLLSRMAKFSDYQYKPCCYLYKKPISGTELDWYYRNGSFAIVAEFGTHQNKPTLEQIEKEFERTWEAFKLFIKEAPLIEIKSGADSSFTFVHNAGIDPEYFEYQKKIIESLKSEF